MNSQDNFDNEQQIDINPNNMDNNNYTSNNGINNLLIHNYFLIKHDFQKEFHLLVIE